jgi:hypothetical protein
MLLAYYLILSQILIAFVQDVIQEPEAAISVFRSLEFGKAIVCIVVVLL